MAVIYLGSPAIDRLDTVAGLTIICKESPASADAYIHTIEIWSSTNLSNCIIATFENTGGLNFTVRDNHNIGNVTAGAKRTISGLNLLVHPGDYIGYYASSGMIETSTGGGQGVWKILGDATSGSHTFAVFSTNWSISLRGIATTYVPTVTTQAVSNIGTITATGNGNITFGHATKRGVCWNITGNPTVADSKSEEVGSFETGAFTSSMTGLSEGQKYYVRAYAYNSNGYGYGSQVEFTTYTTISIVPFIATKRTTSVYNKRGPQIQVYNSKGYYVWAEEDSGGYYQIWTAVLEGNSFVATKKTTSAYNKRYPRLQVVDDIIYYTWSEVDPYNQIWTAVMNIDGSNFVATKRTTSSDHKWAPKLQVVNGYIYYAWLGTDEYGNQIVTAKMNINGTGWASVQRTSYTGTEIPSGPHFYVSEGYIYYAWDMYIFGDTYQIYTARMTTGGSGWTVTKRTTSAHHKRGPRLHVVGSYIYYVYIDYSGTFRDVWTAVMHINGTGWLATQRTTTAYHKEHPQLQVIDDEIHYTYLEVRGVSPNPRQVCTAVMNIDGSGWETVQRTTTEYLRQNPQSDALEYVWRENDDDGYLQIWTGTLLSPPTNVAATDGAYTDKVVITWTKSIGATDYQVYRDDVALGWLGDVATYDDIEAEAPSITHGSVTASDGSSTSHVALSNTGASADNGTTHTYKVKARNVTDESLDSETDTGYRGVGALTYQWYRSAGDSDANYSVVSGAVASTYNDTDVPAGSVPGTPTGLAATDGVHTDKVALTWTNVAGAVGAGRYYKCHHTAEGAESGYTGVNRGYRGAYTLTDVQVKRDTTPLTAVGSLATSYNDTEADAPTITPGVASASDGTSVNHVALSLTGQTTVNGTTHDYYVRTYNEVGWGSWTSANAGYRGVGTLTYQWQRSADDIDVAHSNISGAITASYNDTGAPADGSGRYFRCVENATGATQQISTSDRGYRMYSPTVVTQAANSLTGVSATLNGNITDAGGPITTRGFKYYKEGDAGNVLDVHEDGTFEEGVYGLPISGLINGTKYYFRAYATNAAGTSYGSWLDFTTEVYLPLVTTENPSDIGIDHAKGNGTIVSGANITERGFEVVLIFSGSLQEYTDRKMAGFAGTATYNSSTKKWEGTLTKTITETGTFGAGAFIGNIGAFPTALPSDKIFGGEVYIYKARATNDVGVGYGSWVALTALSYPTGQLPDDQIPIDDVVGIFYYRKAYPKRDVNELREKCRLFQDNMVEYALVINHNSRVLQRFLNDLTLYTGADEYNTFRPIIPTQHLNTLAHKPLDENGFKTIINSFINNSVDNANNVNNNFRLIRGGLSDYVYTEDEGFVNISIMTKVITSNKPDVEGLTRVMDRLNREMEDNYMVINHNSHVLRSILI